jgi:hypothetical protein
MKTKAVSGIMLALLVFCMLSINMIGITLAQETHDIAVISVMPYPTKVGLGELVTITVIVENQGTESETFNVTIYYDDTFIQTQNVTNSDPKTSTTLIFTWNTTDVTVAFYFINATASVVPNETETADNTLISPIKVKVVSPYIVVLPRSTVDPTLTPGKNYTISIYTDYDGSDIWGYQFTLNYNSSVLHGVEVINGDLITEGVQFTEGEFNNTAGTLSLPGAVGLNTTTFPPVRINSTGPGILANVTFTIVGLGEFLITLGSETRLRRGDGTNIIDDLTNLNPDPTQGKFLHGSFQNVPEAIYDVAVISVDPSPTLVEEGEPVTINVTIRNKGTVTTSVSVKVYYGFDPTTGIPLNLIEEETVTLESGVNETLTFTWNTTNVDPGTYHILAVAELLGGVTDINPDDNMLKIDDAVEVKCAPAAVTAIIDIHPHTLNLKSKGKWITCYIELPDGYDVGDIDFSTVMLNDTIPVSLLDVPAPDPVPTEIGDYDGDGIPDLLVKFDRAEVMALLSVGEATLTITGEVAGTPFEGSDTVRVR